jgi:putative MATE family efflux protein
VSSPTDEADGNRSGPPPADLTSGSIARSALRLAAPLLASNAGAVAFQVVDLRFLSWLGNEPMAAAIIVNQTIWQLLLMLMMGASFGTQALIARAIGSGDSERASQTGAQALLLAATVAALVAIAGNTATPFLFQLSGARPEFAEEGIPYLRILLTLNIGLVGGMIARGVLVGSGDGRTPLIVSMVQFPITLLTEWLLVFGNLGFPKLGIRGIAIGLITGQLTALTIYSTVLARGWSRVTIAPRHLIPRPRLLLQILRQSWPPALQMLGMVFTTFAILRIMRGFAPAIQAAYSIGLRLGMIVPLISFPLVNACATLVGQALGARKPERAKATVAMMVKLHVAVMWPLLGLLAYFRHDLLAILTSDPAILEAGSTYLLFFSASFSLVAIYFVILRSLQGAGDFLVPMAISLGTTFLVTIPSAYLLSRTGLEHVGIWTALLLHNIIALTATSYWMSTGKWLRR